MTTTNETIGIQGLAGSNTEAAAQQLFGTDTDIRSYESFDGVFDGLQTGDIGRLVVAYANPNIEFGYVRPTFHEIHTNGSRNWIGAETILWIHHHLMARPGSTLADIRSITTQVEAFDQCEETLTRKYPDIPRVEAKDTALAAKNLTDPTQAAIATAAAAKLYGLDILDDAVQDIEWNPTAFLSWTTRAKGIQEMTGDEDTTLMLVRVPNSTQPATLDTALRVLGAHQINLSDIHSVFIPGSHLEREFFIRADAGYLSDEMQSAGGVLQERGCPITVLGSFVHAELPPKEG